MREEYNQDSSTRIKTLNTEKSNRIETQNSEIRNSKNSSTTKQMRTLKDKINVGLIKKIMTKKRTWLPSFRNQGWKKVKIKTENINKLLPNIPKGNITELNDLFYAWAKLVRDKIGVPLINLDRNRKSGLDWWRNFDSKRKCKGRENIRGYFGIKDQNKTADKSENATWRDQFKDISERNDT